MSPKLKWDEINSHGTHVLKIQTGILFVSWDIHKNMYINTSRIQIATQPIFLVIEASIDI